MGRYLLNEMQRWVSGNSLLMVTITGILTRLYCPFTVECIEAVGELKIGAKYQIDSVGVDADTHLVYFIASKAHPYHHFKILGKI